MYERDGTTECKTKSYFYAILTPVLLVNITQTLLLVDKVLKERNIWSYCYSSDLDNHINKQHEMHERLLFHFCINVILILTLCDKFATVIIISWCTSNGGTFHEDICSLLFVRIFGGESRIFWDECNGLK